VTGGALPEWLGTAAAPVRLVAEACFLAVLAALSVIDFRIRRLPDRVVLPTLWAGLVLNAAGAFTTPAQAVLGAAAGYLSLWLLAALYGLRAGREVAAFGGGDLKLAAAIGAWFGLDALPAALLVAFVAGSCAALPGLLSGRLRLDRSVPFGPALALGGAAVLFAGPSLAGILLVGAR